MQMQLHYLLHYTEEHIYKWVQTEAAKCGMTPGQPKILDFLSTHEGCEQKLIAQECCMQPSTVTGIIRRMRENGLVRCNHAKNNRKSYQVFLTEKGREAQKEADRIFNAAQQKLIRGISPQEQDVFMQTLIKLYYNAIE